MPEDQNTDVESLEDSQAVRALRSSIAASPLLEEEITLFLERIGTLLVLDPNTRRAIASIVSRYLVLQFALSSSAAVAQYIQRELEGNGLDLESVLSNEDAFQSLLEEHPELADDPFLRWFAEKGLRELEEAEAWRVFRSVEDMVLVAMNFELQRDLLDSGDETLIREAVTQFTDALSRFPRKPITKKISFVAEYLPGFEEGGEFRPEHIRSGATWADEWTLRIE